MQPDKKRQRHKKLKEEKNTWTEKESRYAVSRYAVTRFTNKLFS